MRQCKSLPFDIFQCRLGLRLRKGTSDGAPWPLAAPGSSILKPFGSARPRGIKRDRMPSRRAPCGGMVVRNPTDRRIAGYRGPFQLVHATRGKKWREQPSKASGASRWGRVGRPATAGRLMAARCATARWLPETWRRPRSTAHSAFRSSRIVQIRRSMASSPSKMQTNSVAPAWPRR